MTSRQVAEQFVARLQSVVDQHEISWRPVSFDPDLFDIEVTHGDWSLIVSLDKPGETARIHLDDYVIEGITSTEAIEFVAALIAGRAHVRVSKTPIIGRSVHLEVDLGPSRRLSERRRWGSGLAGWEQRLLVPDATA